MRAAALPAPAGGRSRGRAVLRAAGTALIVAAALGAAWVVLVWRWQDPVTALYTRWEQHRLAGQYASLRDSWRPPAPRASPAPRTPSRAAPPGRPRHADTVAQDAAAFRRDTHPGEAIGRIAIPRLGLSMILVNGTDDASLRKGPGRDLETYMPGEHRLVYIAGHRTTFLAPFSHIDAIRPGDPIRLEVPYGTFVYRAVGHEIVPADDLAVLRSPRHELLRLQACNPRFFATQRYIVDATLVRVIRRPAG